MDKKELYRHVGSLQQVAYVRPVTYLEGRSAGLTAYEIKNGPMMLKVLAGKGLDVAEFSYKGTNVNFLSKPGLQGRNQYDTHGDEALRSIMGGLFFTAGLENICAPCTIEGKDYPMHGRIRTTPAEHLCGEAVWDGESYKLRVRGELREAELFGENMVLHREISTEYGSKTLTVKDTVENQSVREEPLMLLYHINMGYPFLDENTRLCIPTTKVTARDKDGEGHEAEYNKMDAPKDGEPEYVFIHELEYDTEGNTEILVLNEPLGLGLKLEFNKKNLPYFMEWKSTASGDYVIGLEPSNSSVYGRPFHEKENSVHKLAPFATETNILKFTMLDGAEEIKMAETSFKAKFKGI